MKFIKNLASVYVVNIINGILGIIFIPVFINNMGLTAYGLYSIYITVVSYMSLAELGISKNLTRLLASEKDETKKREHFQVVVGLYTIVILLLLILLPALSQVLTKWFSYGGELQYVIAWIAVLSVLEYILGIPTSLLQANCISNERFNHYSKFTFLSGLYRYALMFLGILLFENPIYVIGLLVSRKAIDFVVAYKVMGGLPRSYWKPIFHLSKFKNLVSESAVLSGSQALQITIISIGSILVGKNFGVEKLGLYRSIFDLVSKVWLVSNVLGLVTFPMFAKILHKPTENLRTISQIPQYLNLSWSFYCLVGFFGTMLAPYILGIFNFPESDVNELFALLLIGVILNAHANLSYEYLQAGGNYLKTLKLSLLALGILFISYFFMLQHAGFHSIGWAWMVSMLIYALVADYIIMMEIKRYIIKRVLPDFVFKLLTILLCVFYSLNKNSLSGVMICLILLPNLVWFFYLFLKSYYYIKTGDRT
ncbi:lipopolysaccharide biosynthesis protein [Brevibacillus porteri]|uniref:lipopolysaccharide biosynthesis protein n=1 Tax=Brevibacillus porteri TaxID=2126350 RepID=UPI00362E614B